MAIRVNKDGTVIIERVLKVTKEFDSSNLSNFEDNFNRMMCEYATEFENALIKRLEACEEWVKIHGIYYNINEVDSIDKKLYIGTYYYTLESAYNDITFADGKPFGVKTTETYTIHLCKLVAPLNVVKAVKETLHLDLKEAKNIVDKARKEPCRIDNLSKEAADKIAAEINVCGGEAFVGKN